MNVIWSLFFYSVLSLQTKTFVRKQHQQITHKSISSYLQMILSPIVSSFSHPAVFPKLQAELVCPHLNQNLRNNFPLLTQIPSCFQKSADDKCTCINDVSTLAQPCFNSVETLCNNLSHCDNEKYKKTNPKKCPLQHISFI